MPKAHEADAKAGQKAESVGHGVDDMPCYSVSNTVDGCTPPFRDKESRARHPVAVGAHFFCVAVRYRDGYLPTRL